MNNLLLQTDSYKLTHWKQYPKGTEHVYSYLESRGGMFRDSVFFGLQYYLKQYLEGEVFSQEDIEEAYHFSQQHFGNRDYFNLDGWTSLLYKHGGMLPLRIKAVPEGMVAPVKNVLMTVENTDPEFPWLTNYVETLLMKLWYPITVATKSREAKKIIDNYLQLTGDPSLVNFKLHDFGDRGVSSEESAAIGGAAHLVNFMGTDTIQAIEMLTEFYGASSMPGFSVPASEHSTTTSWGREGEVAAAENMLTSYPSGLVSIVGDSWDIFNFCRSVLGDKLREKVTERDGVTVVRPDSGDPVQVVCEILDILGEQFGHSTNSKGFKVLSPKVRVLQGDGINLWSIGEILSAMKGKGWAADNVAFGMGGGLLQDCNRDTMKFAFKCSNITIDGQNFPVYKKPVTDVGKESKKGKLMLVHNGASYQTIQQTPALAFSSEDIMQTVFEDGVITKEHKLADIRQRAAL